MEEINRESMAFKRVMSIAKQNKKIICKCLNKKYKETVCHGNIKSPFLISYNGNAYLILRKETKNDLKFPINLSVNYLLQEIEKVKRNDIDFSNYYWVVEDDKSNMGEILDFHQNLMRDHYQKMVSLIKDEKERVKRVKEFMNLSEEKSVTEYLVKLNKNKYYVYEFEYKLQESK